MRHTHRSTHLTSHLSRFSPALLSTLLLIPAMALADTKGDVWDVVSVKVHGHDAIKSSNNEWKGPIQASFPNTVNVKVTWEPGTGTWSHLADLCHPWSPGLMTSKMPKAYLNGQKQGVADINDTADNQITFTYQVPKDAEFYVYIKCDAQYFSNPDPELVSTFATINLKYQLSVTAQDLADGGFDPYGMPVAPSIEISMPSNPGKFPAADTPHDYAIFMTHTGPTAPQQIVGQFQRATAYQFGGTMGDIAMPADKVYVSQWASHAGPIDTPTNWNGLAYGGPGNTKGVFVQMGAGAQFTPGIYRMRARTVDGALQGWSQWWMFIVGNPQSVKSASTMAGKMNIDAEPPGQMGSGNAQADSLHETLGFGSRANTGDNPRIQTVPGMSKTPAFPGRVVQPPSPTGLVARGVAKPGGALPPVMPKMPTPRAGGGTLSKAGPQAPAAKAVLKPAHFAITRTEATGAVHANQPFTLKVEVQNTGEMPGPIQGLKVQCAGCRIKQLGESGVLAPGAKATIGYSVIPSSAGRQTVQVMLSGATKQAPFQAAVRKLTPAAAPMSQPKPASNAPATAAPEAVKIRPQIQIGR